LVNQNQLDEAESLFRRDVALHPKDATGHYELGNLLALRHQFDAAKQEFEESLNLDYWRSEYAWAGIAYCCLKLGMMKEAAANARKALQIRSDYPYAEGILNEVQQALRQDKEVE
jgi:Tfp pilus assembly protein PilF